MSSILLKVLMFAAIPPSELCTFEDEMICGFTTESLGKTSWAQSKELDHTFGTDNGYVMTIEHPSQPIWDTHYGGDIARLRSTMYPGSTTPSCFQFWFVIHGEQFCQLEVKRETDERSTSMFKLEALEYSNRNDWRFVQIPYTTDEEHVIVIEASHGSQICAIKVDDVLIQERPCETPRCGGNVTLDEGDNITLTSPNYPDMFFFTDYCLWYIEVSEDSRIRIQFDHVKGDEYRDSLEVGNGNKEFNENTRELRLIGDDPLPGDFMSSGNVVWIRWIAGRRKFDEFRELGWKIHVSHMSEAVCEPPCYNEGICRYSDDFLTFCDCVWPYFEPSCQELPTAALGTLDQLINFEEAGSSTFESSGDSGVGWIRTSGASAIANLQESDFPVNDHTYGSKNGYYMAISSIDVSTNTASSLLYHPDGSSCIQFWYYLTGSNTNELNVYIITEKGTESPSWTRKGDFGNKWLMGRIEIPNNSPYFQVKFEAVLKTCCEGVRVAIDDLIVQSDICSCESGMDACDTGEGCVLWSHTCSGASYCADGKDTLLCGHCGGVVNIPPNQLSNIQSPNYPDYYGDNQECVWHVQTDEGYALVVTILDFDIEGNDYLDFSNNRFVSLHYDLRVNGTSIPTWNSDGRDMWLQFTSDDISGNAQGWNLQVSTISAPNLIERGYLGNFDQTISNCGLVQVTDSSDNLDWVDGNGAADFERTHVYVDHTYGTTSGAYIFPDYMYISSAASYIAKLKTVTLTPSFDKSCLQFWYQMGNIQEFSYEHPNYYRFTSTLNVYIYAYTASNIWTPNLLLTRHGDLGYYWRFAQIPLNTPTSYKIMFEATDLHKTNVALDDVKISDSACLSECGYNITLTPGQTLYLTSPGYPSLYANNDNCLWYISTSSGNNMKIMFQDFSTRPGMDYLDIGLHQDPFDLSTRVMHLSGSQLPRDLWLDSNKIWIDWITYYKNENMSYGWRISVIEQSSN
ncbi:MAM and LDL-receptor class A domain-containing protein 1-like [Saccoglossus kowalevskii]